MYLSPLLLIGLVVIVSGLMSLAFKGGFNSGWQDGWEQGKAVGYDEALIDSEGQQ